MHSGTRVIAVPSSHIPVTPSSTTSINGLGVRVVGTGGTFTFKQRPDSPSVTITLADNESYGCLFEDGRITAAPTCYLLDW